jgi:hypothetical protein
MSQSRVMHVWQSPRREATQLPVVAVALVAAQRNLAKDSEALSDRERMESHSEKMRESWAGLGTSWKVLRGMAAGDLSETWNQPEVWAATSRRFSDQPPA